MKFIVLGLSVMFLLGMVTSASAGLCAKCIDQMYIQNIGVCTKCGGSTSSGAFKLCIKCSGNLHKCQNCMAELGPAAGTVIDKAKVKDGVPLTNALELSAEHSGRTITVATGQDIVIRLKGNPTTGYSWKVGEITGDTITSQGEPTYVADAPHRKVVGAGSTFVCKLLANKTGTSTVRLVYVRPWEKDTPPVQTFTVTIEVKEK